MMIIEKYLVMVCSRDKLAKMRITETYFLHTDRSAKGLDILTCALLENKSSEHTL